MATGNQGGENERKRKIVMSPEVNYSEFTVHVVTWNVASAEPSPHDIESLFLPQESLLLNDLYNATDVVVVGLQEAYQNVQEAFSSSVPVVGRDPMVEAFSGFLAKKGFARLASSRLLGILSMVFVKRPLLCYISNVETCTTKTGFGGWLGNKGASSIRFSLGELMLCFTNCHLIPHGENNEKRVVELRDIFEAQMFDTTRLPLMRLLDHDILVLFGDLNFRIDGKDSTDVLHLLGQDQRRELLKFDQLRIEQIKGEASGSKLYYFMEMPIDFQPSYKYEPGSDTFAGTRPPAWCDRILWRMHERRLPKITDTNPRALVTQDYYGIHMQPRTSDHKAVSAGLKLLVDLSYFTPPIVFRLSEWICGLQGVIAFDVAASTEISLWDWVGLYPADFSSVDKDYVLWVLTPAARGRARTERVYTRVLSGEQVPSVPGMYILLYKSQYYDSVIGMSPIFRISTQEFVEL